MKPILTAAFLLTATLAEQVYGSGNSLVSNEQTKKLAQSEQDWEDWQPDFGSEPSASVATKADEQPFFYDDPVDSETAASPVSGPIFQADQPRDLQNNQSQTPPSNQPSMDVPFVLPNDNTATVDPSKPIYRGSCWKRAYSRGVGKPIHSCP